jgi:hypothetical protein
MIREMRRLSFIWTGVAAGGVVGHLLTLREAEIDRIILRNSGRNGPARIVADAAIRREWIRVAVSSIHLIIGSIYLVTHYYDAPVTKGTRAVAGFLSLGQALLLTNAIMDLRARRVAQKIHLSSRRKGDPPNVQFSKGDSYQTNI